VRWEHEPHQKGADYVCRYSRQIIGCCAVVFTQVRGCVSPQNRIQNFTLVRLIGRRVIGRKFGEGVTKLIHGITSCGKSGNSLLTGL